MTFNPFTLRKQLKAHQDSVASLSRTTLDQQEKICKMQQEIDRLQTENHYLKNKVQTLSANNITLHNISNDFALKEMVVQASQPRKQRREQRRQCKKKP